MLARYHDHDSRVNTFAFATPGQMLAMDTIASRLKEARIDSGLTQKELAQKAGVGQSAIGNIESGRSNGAESLHKLATAMGYSLRWLETGDGPKKTRHGPAESPSLGEVLTELARTIATKPKLDRRQLEVLLPLLASDPDSRHETCQAIMRLLNPEREYTYKATWEETARDVARFIGTKAKITPDEFIEQVDKAHAKSVTIAPLLSRRISS